MPEKGSGHLVQGRLRAAIGNENAPFGEATGIDSLHRLNELGAIQRARLHLGKMLAR